MSSWTLLHAHLHQTLKHKRWLQSGERILIAVSGGQDSLCLAKLLLDLQPKWQWKLAIAHCNHQWRKDSTANALYVQAQAQTWQLPFLQRTAESSLAGEAAAREWRYRCLADMAQQQQYRCVVTGHTASDRAETLLYNLIRGSGADGLQALTWQRSLAPEVDLVRPLLNVTRAQTGQFCQEMNLSVWQDSTNQDRSFVRNRIRLDVLPYLAAHLNPQVETALAQTAELLQAEVDFLEAEAAKLRVQSCYSTLPPRFNRRVLQAAPIALQRRVVRQILHQTLPTAPNFDHIEKLIGLISAPDRTQTDPFPGGAIAQVRGDWVQFL